MEGAKNNFEEVKKLLLEALTIMEETNEGLMNRISNLESRAIELENRVKELEYNKAVSADYITAGIAAGVMDAAAEMNSNSTESLDASINSEAVAMADDNTDVNAETGTYGAAGLIIEEESDIETEVIKEQDMMNEPDLMEEQSVMARLEELDRRPEELNVPEILQDLEADGGLEQDNMIGISEEGVGDWTDEIVAVNGAVERVKMVNDMAKPDWYDWEVDYPAAYVEDVYAAISFNDRYEFVKELFNVSGSLDEAEMLFKETLDMINELDNFKNVVTYIRERFPQWDEQSDEVYRFYMAVRRKFNKPQAN